MSVGTLVSLGSAAKERPILFTGQMVRKLLSGEKTETRRIMNPQPVLDSAFRGGIAWKTKRSDTAIECINEGLYPEVCPYGRPGDRLWVREGFVAGHRMKGWELDQYDQDGQEKPPTVWYRADDNEHLMWTHENGETNFEIPWKPSIHMPQWACRLRLELVSVRVERVQDITEEGARAEGAEIAPALYPESGHTSTHRDGFRQLWDRINAKRGSWEENPFVWRVGFRRIV